MPVRRNSCEANYSTVCAIVWVHVCVCVCVSMCVCARACARVRVSEVLGVDLNEVSPVWLITKSISLSLSLITKSISLTHRCWEWI